MLSVIRCRLFLIASAIVLAASNPSLAESEAERAYQQAHQAYANDQFEEARDLLETAVETDAKNPDVFLLLGKSHYQLAEIDEAIAAWRKLLTLAPQNKYARQMVDSLTLQRKGIDTRIATARSLIRKNLVEPAWQELSRLERLKTLSASQEAEVHTLLGEAAVFVDTAIC